MSEKRYVLELKEQHLGKSFLYIPSPIGKEQGTMFSKFYNAETNTISETPFKFSMGEIHKFFNLYPDFMIFFNVVDAEEKKSVKSKKIIEVGTGFKTFNEKDDEYVVRIGNYYYKGEKSSLNHVYLSIAKNFQDAKIIEDKEQAIDLAGKYGGKVLKVVLLDEDE